MKKLLATIATLVVLAILVPSIAKAVNGNTNIWINCGSGHGAASTATVSGTYGGIAFSATCSGHTDGLAVVTGNTSQYVDSTITYPSGSCTWQQDGASVPTWATFGTTCGPVTVWIAR